MYTNKIIPQNYLAEEIILGTIIIYPHIISYTSKRLYKDHFFLEFHGIMYTYLLDNQRKNGNIITLINRMEKNQILKKLGGLYKLINVMQQSQIFINLSKANNYIDKLISTLHNEYNSRLIIQYGYQVIKLGYISLNEKKDQSNKLLLYAKLIEKRINKNYLPQETLTNIKDLVSSKLLEIKYPKIYTTQQTSNIKYGFMGIDKITNGLPCGNLIIIAGRPSVGKTSFAINIVYNTFFSQNISICIFSLEMTSKEVLDKFISIGCELDIKGGESLKIGRNKWSTIVQICEKLLDNNIYINDKNNIDIGYIECTAIKIKKEKHRIKLIVIDYLQLIHFTCNRNRKLNRSQELGYITRRLKLLAQVIKLPILVLSQLNRNIEIRHNKEPLLSDLKESGCLGYRNNLYIGNKYNRIGIKNIKQREMNPRALKSQTLNVPKKNKYINSINKTIFFSQKYLFLLQLNLLNIQITNNHCIISEADWQKIESMTKLSHIGTNRAPATKLKKYKLAYETCVDKINFCSYQRTYDINLLNNFYFICKQIIVHNSIEQDSDIIIMLHSKREKFIDSHKRIIDIKISKNRNGNTGSCEMIFTPGNVTFRDIDERTQANKLNIHGNYTR